MSESSDNVADKREVDWEKTFREFFASMPALPDVHVRLRRVVVARKQISLQIRFNNLSYVVEVPVQSHQIDTVASKARSIVSCSRLRSAGRRSFPVLQELTGNIKPQSTTLVCMNRYIDGYVSVYPRRFWPHQDTERRRCSQRCQVASTPKCSEDR